MKRFQSPTLFRLILVGFFVVAVPLIAAIITAIAQVDRLARESRSALVSVQENATVSRTLADRVTAMERSARQYHALNDASFKDLYTEHRQEVLRLFARLGDSSSNAELQDRLAKSRELEASSNGLVEAVAVGEGITPDKLAKAFDALRASVLEVVQQQNAMARELANAMPDQARGLQRTLIIQAMLVIPLSIGLAILFVVLIVRPLRQIDSSIHGLGRGALSESVQVVGTRDLEELGRRLDWLRLRLLELEAEKSRFLRNVSHELKTPLTNIREGAELLAEADGLPAAPELKAIAQILRDNSLRLQQMIEELLRYGADGNVGEDDVSESVQFDLLVNDVVEEYELTAEARSITMLRSLAPAMVTGNARRLQTIVDNLLSNAVKYTPDDGRIDVELTQHDGLVMLDVRDSGPGIPEKLRPQVFDWFVTGPRPPQWKVAGTGMGLAIAREYAKQQDGDIRLLDSPNGAHFRLTIRTKNIEQS